MEYEVRVIREHGQYVVRPEVTLNREDEVRFAEVGSPTILIGGRVFLMTSLVQRPVFLRHSTKTEADALVGELTAQFERVAEALVSGEGLPEPPPRPHRRKPAAAPKPSPPPPGPGPLSTALHRALVMVAPQVLSEFGLPATASPQVISSLDGLPVDRCPDQVGAIMHMDGQVTVAVGLSADPAAAKAIHFELTGEDSPPGDPEHRATLGELLNMITGSAAGAMQMRGQSARGLPEPGVLTFETLKAVPAEAEFAGTFGKVRLLCAAKKARAA